MQNESHIRVGVGVFVLNQSKSGIPTILIGKRKGSHGAGTYALPGGHLEFGETPEHCATREVLEETGLKVQNVQFLTTTNDLMLAENKHYVTLFMTCVRVDDTAEPRNLEPDKCDGWEWIRWSDLEKWVDEDGVMGTDGVRRTIFSPLINLFRQRPGVVPEA